MQNALYGLIAGLFTWGMTILGSLSIYSLKSTNKSIMSLFLGFGGGVMVAASFFSLILPAIDYCQVLNFNIVPFKHEIEKLSFATSHIMLLSIFVLLSTNSLS